MRVFITLLLLIASGSAVLYNVDQPVPVSLAHGEYYAGVRLWGSGGVLARLGVGLFNRLTLGLSYGGNQIVGSAKPAFFGRNRPEIQARLAILEEMGYVPNLLLGFDSQGYDDYVDSAFQVREKGGYLCVGKTIDVSRTYCVLGANYWHGFNGFVAVNQLLPGNVEIIAEYDAAINDRTDKNRGFLNFGLAWTFGEKMRLCAGLRDVLGNRDETRLNRVFELAINNSF
ncbi:MAG: hypothetical protein ABIK86_04805 [candidate division WOR-3 bacterium]